MYRLCPAMARARQDMVSAKLQFHPKSLFCLRVTHPSHGPRHKHSANLPATVPLSPVVEKSGIRFHFLHLGFSLHPDLLNAPNAQYTPQKGDQEHRHERTIGNVSLGSGHPDCQQPDETNHGNVSNNMFIEVTDSRLVMILESIGLCAPAELGK